MDSIKKLEEKWMMNQQSSNNMKSRAENDEQCLEKACNREVCIKLSGYFIMSTCPAIFYFNALLYLFLLL